MEGPRAARESELKSVIGLSNAVFAPDGRIDMGAAFPTLFCADNLQNLRICVDDGVPVSLVGQTVRDILSGGARLRTVSIGSVCTLDSYRGKGLAAALMDDGVAAARSQGAVLAFVSGGRGLYRRMGCIDAGLYTALVTDKRTRAPAARCEVRAWTPADVPALCALHRREPVRYCRSNEDTLALLQCGHVHACRGRTWVALVDGRPAAWLAAAFVDPVNGKSMMCVREVAGSRAAALAALPAIRRDAGVDIVEVDVPESDTETAALASSLGIKTEPRGFPGTIKVIDREGFFSALRDSMAERAAELTVDVGTSVRFSLAGQELVVDAPGDLAALVFGSREQAPPLAPEGRLRDALARVFPLPLPTYGLSYI